MLLQCAFLLLLFHAGCVPVATPSVGQPLVVPSKPGPTFHHEVHRTAASYCTLLNPSATLSKHTQNNAIIRHATLAWLQRGTLECLYKIVVHIPSTTTVKHKG
jgi:hypothetical protein